MPFPFAAVAGVLPDVITMFKAPTPSPEEQAKKAQTWYRMLQDFARDQSQDTIAFGNRWKGQLPFAQKRTKEDFLNNHIYRKSPESIIDHLVVKINDELTPDFAAMAKDDILNGMGVGSSVSPTPAMPNVVTGSGIDLLTVANRKEPVLFDQNQVKESQNMFFLLGLALLIVGVVTFMLYPRTRRRR